MTTKRLIDNNIRKKQPSEPESPFIYKNTKSIARQILKVLVRSLAKDVESQKKLVNGAIKLLKADDKLLKQIKSNPHLVTDDKTIKLAIRFLKHVASGADGKYTKWANKLLGNIRKAVGSCTGKRATSYSYNLYPMGLQKETGEITAVYRKTPEFSKIADLAILNPERPKNQTNSRWRMFWVERAKELKKEFEIKKTLRTLDKIESKLKKYSEARFPPLIARDTLSLKSEVIAQAKTAIRGLRKEMGKEDLLNLVMKYQKQIELAKDKKEAWTQNRPNINDLFLKLFKKPMPDYIADLLADSRCSGTLIALAFISHKYQVQYESLRSLYNSEDYADLRAFLGLK